MPGEQPTDLTPPHGGQSLTPAERRAIGARLDAVAEAQLAADRARDAEAAAAVAGLPWDEVQPNRSVTVRFAVEGFHCWPEAATLLPERAYLADRHRHMFHYEVRVAVMHNDRDVEFHDLLAMAREHAPSGEMGRLSCEDMAQEVGYWVRRRFGGHREYAVSVFEDGEVGATLRWEPIVALGPEL